MDEDHEDVKNKSIFDYWKMHGRDVLNVVDKL